MEKISKGYGVPKMSTKQLAVMSMLAAVSIIFVYTVRFPIFPAAPFLEYDPADIPILICTFMYGPAAGLVLTVVVSVIQGLTVSAGSEVIGVIMHIVSTGICAVTAGMIYQRDKTRKTAGIALAIGALIMTGAMVIMNMILTPIFTGASREAVMGMMLPIIIPFNLIKASANCFVTFIVYKSISHIVKK